MITKIFLLAVVAAILSVCVADNKGCPHPNEAKNLILQQIAVTPASSDGRQVVHVEVPSQVLGRSDLSCITVVANQAGSTPDFVSFGRNKYNGYSIIIHSRLRNPLNATLYVYTS